MSNNRHLFRYSTLSARAFLSLAQLLSTLVHLGHHLCRIPDPMSLSYEWFNICLDLSQLSLQIVIDHFELVVRLFGIMQRIIFPITPHHRNIPGLGAFPLQGHLGLVEPIPKLIDHIFQFPGIRRALRVVLAGFLERGSKPCRLLFRLLHFLLFGLSIVLKGFLEPVSLLLKGGLPFLKL